MKNQVTSKNDNNSKYKRKKITLLLDGETIELLREYGIEVMGTYSVSASVRAMAKEYGRRKKEDMGLW